MAIASLRKFLTVQTTALTDPRLLFWYSLSLLLAAYYGVLVLQAAFSSEYVIQDDARQHVFWMLRFVDPALLPNDFMADYFASRATWGYRWLYHEIAALGLHPFTFNKVLPPLLSLITTHYCFRFSLQILPVPAIAFTSTVLLNQTLWMRDDLVSGTPRAFIYALLLAFLVYLNARAIIPCLLVLALQPLLYPHCALLSAGILVLQGVKIERGRPRLSTDTKTWGLTVVGLGLLFVMLLPYAWESSEFGPLVTPSQARVMPEFAAGGRASYFVENPILFWFGDRPGFMPTPVLTPPVLIFSLFFPLLWWRSRHVWMITIRRRAAILQQLVLASLGWYFLAHLLLFRLHLPSRYTHHSLRILFALAASFTIGIVVDHWLGTAASPRRNFAQKCLAGGSVLLIAIAVFSYSTLTQSFPFTNNRVGELPELYQYLQATPKATVIASLTKETSNLHTFAQRSPLVSPELGLPYHTGYYQTFRQRTVDLINAQYTENSDVVRQFIERYGIDLWLLDDLSFSPEHLEKNRWLNQYQPAAKRAIAQTRLDPKKIVLERLKSTCLLRQVERSPHLQKRRSSSEEAQLYWLLDTQCLLEETQPP